MIEFLLPFKKNKGLAGLEDNPIKEHALQFAKKIDVFWILMNIKHKRKGVRGKDRTTTSPIVGMGSTISYRIPKGPNPTKSTHIKIEESTKEDKMLSLRERTNHQS